MEVTYLKRFTTSILLNYKVACCEMNNYEVLLKPFSVTIQSLLTHVSDSWSKLRTSVPTPRDLKETVRNEFLTLGEVNMVMGELGLPQCCSEGDTVDILAVYDDDEPSLGEVKMAFDVFDENSDGFIDEFELQRMLCKFGQSEKATLEQCVSMIKGFDVNGDGLIDFDEFVKLMETCSF